MAKAWVEIDEEREPIRVFKNRKAMVLAMPYLECGWTVLMDRRSAVGKIRERIWKRQEGVCAMCPEILIRKSAHLHERVFRSKGGAISLDNSEILCYNCHINGIHGNRKPWSKST